MAYGLLLIAWRDVYVWLAKRGATVLDARRWGGEEVAALEMRQAIMTPLHCSYDTIALLAEITCSLCKRENTALNANERTLRSIRENTAFNKDPKTLRSIRTHCQTLA
jgi:hypothetical protein